MQETIKNGLQVIKASAGSGKTYTLTLMYIQQLLFCSNSENKLVLRNHPGYHRHILAITFTNKATDEMKKRIITELYQLSQDPVKSDYYEYFQTHCTIEAIEGLQDAAAKALMNILFNYSEFTVSTIDSFFQSIVRCFARELDRDYNYEIQVDGDFAVSVAVHLFLVQLARDMKTGGSHDATTIEKWVRDLIHTEVAQGKKWNFYSSTELIKFARKINSELFRSRMTEMRCYLFDTDDGKTVTNLEKIQSFKQMLIKARNYYEAHYKNDFTGKMKEIMNRYGINDENFKSNAAIYSFLSKDKMKDYELAPSLRDTNADNIRDKFKTKFNPPEQSCTEILQLVGEVVKSFDRWKLLDKMVKNIGLLGLLGVIDEKLEEYRKDTNTILIADTNELIGRIVGDDYKNSIPFIYERAGTWINHYMIDEFQDTSMKQYQNFRPLLYESLSHTNDNFNLIIGDAKQSIYRFRNADPSIFRDHINEDFKNNELHDDTLYTNYRSLPTVIDFNNDIFKKIIDEFAPDTDNSYKAKILRRTYMPKNDLKDFQQEKHAKEPEGLVRIITADSQNDPIKNNEQVLEMLPEYLLKLHERYDWRHIGILCYSHNDGNEIVSRILEHNAAHPEQRIEITSDESMLLKNSAAVQQVISTLRFIDLAQYKIEEEADVDDEESATDKANNVGKPNSRRLNDQRMFRALNDFISLVSTIKPKDAASTGELLAQSLETTKKNETDSSSDTMSYYAELLKELLPDVRTCPLSLTSIVENVVSNIMKKDYEVETTFLMALMDYVIDFEATSVGGTVREFLRYWDQKKDSLAVASASTSDSISIMTIHKSKGLEFECVVIPFLKWKIDDLKDHTLWMPSDYWHEQTGINNIFTEVPNVTYDPKLIPPILPLPRKEAEIITKTEDYFTKYLDEIHSDSIIDNLNKTYVAFTRPREELHIFAFTANNTYGNLVLDKAQKMKKEIQGEEQPSDTGIIEFGMPRSIHKREDEKKKKKTDSDVTINDMPSYYVSPAPTNLLVKLPHDITAAQDEGTRLHNLLSRINYSNDADKALMFGIKRGIIEEQGKWNISNVKKLFNDLFTDPVTSPWFSTDNTIYTERSLVDNASDTKRPDRVVRRPDGTMIVIDYKFGEQRKSYHRQVAEYMRRLKLMGHDKVEGYLLYIQPETNPIVIKVKE